MKENYLKEEKKELFECLYNKYHSMVIQVCLGYVQGDTQDANDLSQEIFIRIWNNLDSFREESSYKTWIYRITVNSCLHFVKKQNREQYNLVSEIPNMEGNIETIIEKEENVKMLYSAIGKLNEVERILIILVLENQSHQDIALIMGMSSVNVRVRIHRVKKRLEKIIKTKNHE